MTIFFVDGLILDQATTTMTIPCPPVYRIILHFQTP